MSDFMCSECGEAYMYCACEGNPLNIDNISLNGSGGITRRMTDKERINELEKQLEEKDYILTELHEILNVPEVGSFIDAAQRKVNKIQELEKQLAESVPKKVLQKLIESPNAYAHIKKLLTNHRE